MARNVDSAPVRAARGIGGGFVHSTAFEVLTRAGFVARGLIYGIIGLFAFEVAVSDTGKLTNQQGAIRTVASQPFGEFLLLLLAIGLGGYAIWRIFRAALGHGPEDSDSTLERLGGLGRPRVRRSLYRVDQVAHGLVGGRSVVEARPNDCRRLRLARGPLARRARGGRDARGGRVPARQGVRQTFLEAQDRRDVRGAGDVGDMDRHDRPRRAGRRFGLIGWFLLKAAYEFEARRRSVWTAP